MSPRSLSRPWRGEWVARRLDVALATDASPLGVELADLVGLAVRRNPRRAHLMVSSVLGKHWPADPRLVYGSGLLLGALVRLAVAGPDHDRGSLSEDERERASELLLESLAHDPRAPGELVRHARAIAGRAPLLQDAVVVGYAETATALGHAVADALDAPVLHSTRRPVAGVTPFGGFEESHSHATSHLLLPEDPALLAGAGPLVLVDDELSTGSTLLNTITTLHGVQPHTRYVVAALVDLRGREDRARMDRFAAELGVRIDVVSLASGRVDLPADVLERGRALVAEVEAEDGSRAASRAATHPAPEPAAAVARVHVTAPAGLREGGRHGFTPSDRVLLEQHLRRVAGDVVEQLTPQGRVHVLGFEELMYAPLRLAERLVDLLGDRCVTYSTTTRSPVLPVDAEDYAIRSAVTFPAHDDPVDGPGDRFAYNLAASDGPPAIASVVLVIDAAADTPQLHGPSGLLAQLSGLAERIVLVVLDDYRPAVLPTPLRGPGFGSYPPADVAWLLKDLSDVELEAPTEEREEAIQSGGAHYAESLPVEYQPSAAYQALFTASLDESAERLAYAVGLVTEQVLRLRGPGAVLVSLARAGTPVGLLMRRWAQWRHGLDLPHYALSIVRGRGIDHVALRYLAAHHEPAAVMFVDGWTGKGAITRELEASVAAANAALGTAFSPAMAVLADTGRCVEIFGTRDDYLIPSACLNSTVSGLISRTVLNSELIGPGDFHGAKFYAGLADSDVSMTFIETVAASFEKVAGDVARDLPEPAAPERAATWAGLAAVERISAAYGIDDVNLVKPGVGETTRVLLRRVPWKILIRAEAAAELQHVLLLAEQRGVEVVELPADLRDIPYSCVGLIHPRFTRGATGADGRTAGGAA